jgi:gamma-glutamyltranspeptidase/glutathione hydrolase
LTTQKLFFLVFLILKHINYFAKLKKNKLIQKFQLLLLLFFLNVQFSVYAETFKNGMVVSAHPLASAVGVEILKQGGNAVDAAVAVEFALAVVYPNAGNIGGGGYMVYRSAGGAVSSLDFRETAPSKASRDMYLDKNGIPVSDLSQYGSLAAGIPGSVAGMVEAHSKYGKLTWKKLIEPAIHLASKGFQLTAGQALELNKHHDAFIKYNSGKTVFTGKEQWKEGDILKQPELAKTLSLIRSKGRKGFYEGRTARLIVAEMNRGNGIVKLSDLKEYRAIWREPVVGNYKNYKIISMPPSSSGGIALISLLKSVEPFPLSKWGFQQDSTIRLMVEAERRIYADRSIHMGDPDFSPNHQKELLNDNYIKDRMSSVSFNKATPSSEVKPGILSGYESEQTTHFSIVDKDGNAVSITTTLNGTFGSHVVVGGAGFLLNNEMDDFSIKAGFPNAYGLVGGFLNAIEPNKRMLSSMTPTILEKDGKLFLVLGSPGGSTIITSVFQTILNIVEFGMPVQNAVDAPRFHHQWLPDKVYVEENAIQEKVREQLKSSGYHFEPKEKIGRIDAIQLTPDGLLEGGADSRGDDAVSAF